MSTLNTQKNISQLPHTGGRPLCEEAGFTLLEALIYIALFVFVIGGSLATAYNIFEGSANIQAKAQREMELNFVLRKLDWMLSGSSIVNPPAPPSGNPPNEDDSLIVNKGGVQYTFATDGTDTATFQVGSPPADPLTTDQLNITNLTFEHVAGTPDVMNITMTVNGEDIGPITRYVRQ